MNLFVPPSTGRLLLRGRPQARQVPRVPLDAEPAEEAAAQHLLPLLRLPPPPLHQGRTHGRRRLLRPPKGRQAGGPEGVDEAADAPSGGGAASQR